MTRLIPWRWAGGALQLAITATNFVVRKKVNCRQGLLLPGSFHKKDLKCCS